MTTTDDNGGAITSNDDVTLGDEITIAVNAEDTAITDFYLGDCVADNGEAQFQADGTTPNADYRSLQIVTGGCMESLGSLENEIEASMTGKELIFKQFAFADESQGKIEPFKLKLFENNVIEFISYYDIFSGSDSYLPSHL